MYFNTGMKLSFYNANTFKPLKKDEIFMFKGRNCFVTDRYENGIKYEYCNIGIRNGSRLHGFMWLDWEYIRKHGDKPRQHWIIK